MTTQNPTPHCIGGDCRPEWNWRRVDCPVHGDPDADTWASETLQRASEREGALKLSFTMVVLPSLVAELRDEGERLWKDEYRWLPVGWSDEDYVRYALARRLRAGEAGR